MYFAAAFNPFVSYLTAMVSNVQSFLTSAVDGTTLIDAITSAIGTVLDWIGLVLTSILSTSGELNPLLVLFAIGIAISGVLISVKIIKSFIWGS